MVGVCYIHYTYMSYIPPAVRPFLRVSSPCSFSGSLRCQLAGCGRFARRLCHPMPLCISPPHTYCLVCVFFLQREWLASTRRFPGRPLYVARPLAEACPRLSQPIAAFRAVLGVPCVKVATHNVFALAYFFFLTVGLRHLKAGVHLPNSWHVVRNERLQLGLKVHLLRLVSRNIIKKLLHLVTYLQTSIVSWIVGAGYILIVITVIVLVVTLGLSPSSCRRPLLLRGR